MFGWFKKKKKKKKETEGLSYLIPDEHLEEMAALWDEASNVSGRLHMWRRINELFPETYYGSWVAEWPNAVTMRVYKQVTQ